MGVDEFAEYRDDMLYLDSYNALQVWFDTHYSLKRVVRLRTFRMLKDIEFTDLDYTAQLNGYSNFVVPDKWLHYYIKGKKFHFGIVEDGIVLQDGFYLSDEPYSDRRVDATLFQRCFSQITGGILYFYNYTIGSSGYWYQCDTFVSACLNHTHVLHWSGGTRPWKAKFKHSKRMDYEYRYGRVGYMYGYDFLNNLDVRLTAVDDVVILEHRMICIGRS